MPLIHCAECQREISDQAPTCPGCGAPMTSVATPPRKKRHVLRWILAIIGVVFVLYVATVIIWMYTPESDGSIARAAERSWAQQFKDPSSVVWDNVTVIPGAKKDERVVCGTVNARNAFGAYVGDVPFGGYAFIDSSGHVSDVGQLLVANDPDTTSIVVGAISKICTPGAQ